MTNFGVGGFLAPVPERTKEAITRYFPSLDAQKIGREAEWYRLMRDEGRHNPAPEAAKKRLRTIRRQCVDLLEQLQSPAFHPLRHIIRLSAAADAVGCASEAETALRHLAVSLAQAERAIPSGRRPNPHRSLVQNLAKMLTVAGLDTSPSGGSPLCQLMEIVLDGVGELEGVANRSDAVLKIVRGAYGLR